MNSPNLILGSFVQLPLSHRPPAMARWDLLGPGAAHAGGGDLLGCHDRAAGLRRQRVAHHQVSRDVSGVWSRSWQRWPSTIKVGGGNDTVTILGEKWESGGAWRGDANFKDHFWGALERKSWRFSMPNLHRRLGATGARETWILVRPCTNYCGTPEKKELHCRLFMMIPLLDVTLWVSIVRGGPARRRRQRDASVWWQKPSGQRQDLRFTNLLRTCWKYWKHPETGKWCLIDLD